MSNRRVLGPAEAGIMVLVAVVTLVLVALSILWPLALVLPLSVLGLWIAVSLLVRAYLLRRHGLHESEHAPHPAGDTDPSDEMNKGHNADDNGDGRKSV
jgi:cardiolipin synthase